MAIAAMAALGGLALAAPPPRAAVHRNKKRAVGASPNYVELQMYSPGQNNVSGHTITTFDSVGNPIGTPFTFPPNSHLTVPNAENQRTILVGEPGANPDFTAAFQVVTNTGGAVCFENVDCVTFGAYGGGPFNPPTGTPAAPGGIPVGGALVRSIAPGCPTLLEGSDDTNDSATDFSLGTQNPRNNATVPAEQSCGGSGSNPGGGPDTKIDKGPKKKTKKKRATFEFSSPTAGVTFECSIDGRAPKGAGSFGPCASPFKVKVGKGKHDFQVRAVLGGVPDGSPAERIWKVKRKRKK